MPPAVLPAQYRNERGRRLWERLDLIAVSTRVLTEAAAIEQLRPAVVELFASADAAEGVQSFVERRQARFSGR